MNNPATPVGQVRVAVTTPQAPHQQDGNLEIDVSGLSIARELTFGSEPPVPNNPITPAGQVQEAVSTPQTPRLQGGGLPFAVEVERLARELFALVTPNHPVHMPANIENAPQRVQVLQTDNAVPAAELINSAPMTPNQPVRVRSGIENAPQQDERIVSLFNNDNADPAAERMILAPVTPNQPIRMPADIENAPKRRHGRHLSIAMYHAENDHPMLAADLLRAPPVKQRKRKPGTCRDDMHKQTRRDQDPSTGAGSISVS